MRATSSPQQPDYDEYNDFIARDLSEGMITWSPDGFTPWQSAATDAKADQARIVLLGGEYAYFAQYRDHGLRSETDSALVIKYLLPIHRARELRSSPKAVPIPSVQLHFFVAGGVMRPLPVSPGWNMLVRAVETARSLAKAPIVRAANWLLSAQRAVVASREYRFSRDTEDPGALILRQHDEPIEIDETNEDGVFLALHKEQVTPKSMGLFFEDVHRRAEEEGGQATFEWSERRAERAHFARLQFDRRLDDYTVRFRSDPRAIALVSANGYIRPADSGSVLQRQRRALLELETRQRHLAAQLMAPHGVRLRDDPVDVVTDEAGRLVKQIQETWPFFAVQGPPGTGKTYVGARLAHEVLKAERRREGLLC